ncbi:uncharacterized protein EDB93DRAFT_1247194 [Suillus bovinus]|uniref:uncharacterized protein n=1 Tax=Suillus bovinus TaxID=48563 RepID=UPI001B86CBF6|nr:uncharacterized protein EDB93DRAFT_1247194 [Suillus bovinus]KAG2156484.1 hypothetical protein EDB93DRAFT_1247194 [Suillus bovinus]
MALFFPEPLKFPDVLATIPSSSQSPTPSSSALLVDPGLLTWPPALNKKKLCKKGSACLGSFYCKPHALCCICGMCLKHCVEILGGCTFHQAKSNNCEPTDEEEQPKPEYPWTDYELPVDNKGFGYEELRQALQVLLAEQGLEVPLIPPPGLSSIHKLLKSVPGPTPSKSLALVPSQLSDNPTPVSQHMHSIPPASLSKPS